jgi:hypothetical protein
MSVRTHECVIAERDGTLVCLRFLNNSGLVLSDGKHLFWRGKNPLSRKESVLKS